ncbi:MAG: hypothetical protein ACM3JH_00545 [Acidithiobacillales bacterium]
MRTTLTLDDDVAVLLKERARRQDLSFRRAVNDALRAGLLRTGSGRPRRYRLKPASLGGPLPGIDLDKALGLSGTLEDLEIARKLELRK